MAFSRKKILVPLVFILGLVLAYAVQKGGYQAVVIPLETGKPAPDIVVQQLDGQEVRLSDYRGNVVFLNFWATWCPPCREEMPSMERLHAAMKGRPFVMLAVSVDSDRDMVERFNKMFPYSFPILWDSTQKASLQYQTTGVPETFIIAPDGTLVYKVIGPDDWSTPENFSALEKLLPPRGAGQG
ncbi:MAG: TlpA disulfide reductase family protein [bacterium]|nr:TlpA disulfide reductase family protein [bacterium]